MKKAANTHWASGQVQGRNAQVGNAEYTETP
jgi:hypothetical protein